MWTGFGVVWDLRVLGLISTRSEEIGNLCSDFAAKVCGSSDSFATQGLARVQAGLQCVNGACASRAATVVCRGIPAAAHPPAAHPHHLCAYPASRLCSALA
jgi:hypothetical protein